MRIEVKGPIINDGDQWIYDWFGIPATSPSKVKQQIDRAIRNQDREIIVEINSGGGSVYAASEIYTALKSFNGKVINRIVGLAASAASVIASSGYCEMSPTGQLMIHNASTRSDGNYQVMDETSDFLQKVDQSIINAYVSKTGKSVEELKVMMDKTTWMTAQEALEHGFIDAIMFQNEPVAVANVENPMLVNGVLPQEVIDKVRNELLKDKSLTTLNDTTNSIPVQNEGKAVEKMDIEKLKNEYPELYEQVKNEGYQEGVKAENARIKAIEDLGIPGSENLVNKAKFETMENAEQLAVNIIKAQKETGLKYLENRTNEAAEINEVQGSEAPETGNAAEKEVEATANTIASFVNKMRKRGGQQ